MMEQPRFRVDAADRLIEICDALLKKGMKIQMMAAGTFSRTVGVA